MLFFFAVDGISLSSDALLHPAKTAPEWLTRGVVYQIQPRTFTAEGTLRAGGSSPTVWCSEYNQG